MRALSAELAELLHRTDPQVGTMVEIQRQTAWDTIRTKQRWQGADSTTGFTIFDSGEVKLAPTGSTVIESTTSNGDLTDLNFLDGAAHMARVIWASVSDPTGLELLDFMVRVHPRINGGNPQEVVWWELRVYAVSEVYNAVAETYLPTLMELTDPLNPLRILETGSVEHDIVFDFSSLAHRIVPTRYRTPVYAGGVPATLFEIRPVKANSQPAANAVWKRDNGVGEIITNGNILEAVTTTVDIISETAIQGAISTQALNMVPRCRLRTGTVSAGVLVFGTNPINLGSTPAEEVELIGLAIVLAGTSVTFQVETNHGSGSYVSFVNGQTLTELGVTKRTLYRMKVTATPNTANTASPIILEMGAFARTSIDVSAIATVVGIPSAMSPIDLRSEVTNPTLILRKTGEKDFTDPGTLLFSNNYIGALRILIYIGSRSLAKSFWMHYDSFLVRNTTSTDSALVIECISMLDMLKRRLPREVDVGGGSIEREAIIYTAQTLKAVYDGLMDHLLIPNNIRGAGVEDIDANHVVSYTIRGTTANERLTQRDSDNVPGEDGQLLLEAIAFLAGGTVNTTRGIVKFFNLHTANAPIVALPYAQIDEASPGYSSRTPEYFVLYGYDPNNGEYRKEVRSFHDPALSNLGSVGAGNPAYCPEHVARWIPETPATGSPAIGILASTIASRQARAFGAGVMLWTIRSSVPHPELEICDRVAFPLSLYVDRDPNSNRAIRGQQWAVGRIIICNDFAGTSWQVLVSYADLLDAQQAIIRLGYNTFTDPRYLRWQNSVDVLIESITSSGLGSFSATNTFDSNFGNTGFNVDSAVPGAYVQVRFLSGPREFTGMWMYMLASGSTARWKIRYSDNGSAWTDAATDFYPTLLGWNARRWPIGVGAHEYWRVELVNTPGAGPDIAEIAFELRGGNTDPVITDNNFPRYPTFADPIQSSINDARRWIGNLEGDQEIIGGNFHVGSGNDVEVGTIASTSYWNKTIRISAAVVIGETDADADDYTGDQGGLIHPFSAAARNFIGAIPLIPQGAEITAVRFRGYREGSGDLCQCKFQRIGDDGARTVLATLTHATTGYATTSANISETVGVSPYAIYVNMDAVTTPSGADTAFVWFEIDYRISKVRQGL